MSDKKTKYKKEKTRETKVFPDKAYDPMKMFSQRLSDNNDKNAPRTIENEDDVVKRSRNYPGDKKDKYKQIKDLLSKKENDVIEVINAK